eukprot:363998-Chlamydomonas_euryale.AAC.11
MRRLGSAAGGTLCQQHAEAGLRRAVVPHKSLLDICCVPSKILLTVRHTDLPAWVSTKDTLGAADADGSLTETSHADSQTSFLGQDEEGGEKDKYG